jgi:hypothetical protein
MLPPQILLNNLLYDASQVTIPGDRVDVDYLQKPKKWSVAVIRRYMIWMGLVELDLRFPYLRRSDLWPQGRRGIVPHRLVH